MYFEVIELTAGEVDKRLIQRDLGIVNDIESLFLCHWPQPSGLEDS